MDVMTVIDDVSAMVDWAIDNAIAYPDHIRYRSSSGCLKLRMVKVPTFRGEGLGSISIVELEHNDVYDSETGELTGFMKAAEGVITVLAAGTIGGDDCPYDTVFADAGKLAVYDLHYPDGLVDVPDGQIRNKFCIFER